MFYRFCYQTERQGTVHTYVGTHHSTKPMTSFDLTNLSRIMRLKVQPSHKKLQKSEQSIDAESSNLSALSERCFFLGKGKSHRDLPPGKAALTGGGPNELNGGPLGGGPLGGGSRGAAIGIVGGRPWSGEA